MIIERTKNEIILKFSNTLNIDHLQDIADWIQYMEITAKTMAKQEDVDKLVKQVKKGRWERRKKDLIK